MTRTRADGVRIDNIQIRGRVADYNEPYPGLFFTDGTCSDDLSFVHDGNINFKRSAGETSDALRYYAEPTDAQPIWRLRANGHIEYAGVHADAAHAAVIDAMPDHCFSAGAQFQRAVSITVTPSLGKGCRGRDVSNYSYAAKLIEDGLVQSGVLRGDEADKVASMTLYAPVVDRGSPSGLHVTITEVPA